MNRNPETDWLKLIGIVLVFFIIMLVIAGCAYHRGCDVETTQKLSCPDGAESIIVFPGGTAGQ